jgi:hypothetical protein
MNHASRTHNDHPSDFVPGLDPNGPSGVPNCVNTVSASLLPGISRQNPLDKSRRSPWPIPFGAFRVVGLIFQTSSTSSGCKANLVTPPPGVIGATDFVVAPAPALKPKYRHLAESILSVGSRRSTAAIRVSKRLCRPRHVPGWPLEIWRNLARRPLRRPHEEPKDHFPEGAVTA